MDSILRQGEFYGQTNNKCDLPGLSLTETSYRPLTRVPRHSHERAYFCFILSGSYTEIYSNETRTCEPWTLAFHPSQEVHSEHIGDQEVRSFNVELSSSCKERIGEYSNILDQPRHLQAGSIVGVLATRIYREFQQMDEVSPLAIEGLVLELMVAASRGVAGEMRGKYTPWLCQAKDLLHARFATSLSLSDVSQAVGVHPAQLAREFRHYYRCSIGEYIRKLRVEHACVALKGSTAPLGDIAQNVGFYDQSHFCKVFRKCTGVTPLEYRRLLPSLPGHLVHKETRHSSVRT